MIYPGISNCIESVENPHGSFRTLKNIKFLRDLNGEPYYISGSNSVTFKAYMDDKPYALKFFTNYDPEGEKRYLLISEYINTYGSPYFKKQCFLPGEFFVFDPMERGNYFPVLISEFAEDKSLSRILYEKCSIRDITFLSNLAANFDKMALWLLEKEFAHGDIKPDNIIVSPDGSLTLIDTDGIFIPAFRGKESNETGTKYFQHPFRTSKHYDRNIDDFSLCLSSLALHAIIEDPSIYNEYEDKFVFSPTELISGDELVFFQI